MINGVRKWRNLPDAQRVLESPRYKRVEDDICFRGQTRHYSVKRPFPHPFFSDADGNEALVLPGYWRKFLGDDNNISNKRPMGNEENSFLHGWIGDKLHYSGIDVPGLRQRNLERYGPHFDSNAEDFPDPESREFARRYNQKLSMSNERDLIEQHYGFPTVGLDVTFDLKTAVFFATNELEVKKMVKQILYQLRVGIRELFT